MAIISHVEPSHRFNITLGKKWEFEAGAPVYSDIAVGDINGDGKKEIVFKSNNEKVIALSAEGEKLWSTRIDEGTDMQKLFLDSESITTVCSSPVLADITGDGKEEIIVGGTNGRLYCLNGQGEKLWEFHTGGPIHSTAAVGDIDGDGKPEIIFGSDDHLLYCLDSHGNKLWSFETMLEIESGIMLADINNDDQPEILFGSNDNNLYCLKGNGELLWKFSTFGPITGRPQVGILHNDGQQKVVFGSQDSHVYVLRASGSLEWKYKTSGRIISEVALIDVNFDSKLEIVVTNLSQESNLIVLSNMHDEIGRFNAGFWVASSPRIADLDKDGNYEIIFGSYDHHLYILTFQKNLNEFFHGELKQEVTLYDTGAVIVGSPACFEEKETVIVTANKQGKVIALKF